MLETTKKRKGLVSQRILVVLKTRIEDGQYRLGTWLPTERELSAEFDADRSAVRTALADLAESGLIEREPGKRPRVAVSQIMDSRFEARKAQNASTRTIALVLPQHESDHASREIMRGLNDVLRAQKSQYRLLIFDINLRSAPRRVLEQEAQSAIVADEIAGAVVWPTLEQDSGTVWKRLSHGGHPIVFVDRFDTAEPIDYVGVDNYAAAKEVVEYLMGLGHRRIAHLTNDESVSSVLERSAGYRDALRTVGITGEQTVPWVVTMGFDGAKQIEDFITSCLSSSDAPTAVFAVNDFLAHRLIAHLEARGIRIPEQLSVVGFDDDDRFSPRPALLTTVRQPFERIGQRAAALLLQRLNSPEMIPNLFQHVLMPTSLIERKTCRPLI